MPKFCDWTKVLKYGKLRPIGVHGENFVDPLFGKCRSKDGEFKKGHNHKEMINFTRRWTKVLRHDIGRGGAPRCDELRWVPVETFIHNDFSRPKEFEGKKYGVVHYQTNRSDIATLNFRAGKLLEGYRHALASRSGRRRMLIVGLNIDPDEVEEMIRVDPAMYNLEAVRECLVGSVQSAASSQHRSQAHEYAVHKRAGCKIGRRLSRDICEELALNRHERDHARWNRWESRSRFLWRVCTVGSSQHIALSTTLEVKI